MVQWMNLQWTKKFINPTQLYITCEKSGGPHLAELGLTAFQQAGSSAVQQTKFGGGLKF